MTDAYVDQLPDFVEAFAADDELVVWNASEADINLQTQGSRWDHILAQLDLSFASNGQLTAHKDAIPLDHADGSVTLAKLANMPADTIRMRVGTIGVPQDAQIGSLTPEPTPVAGDVLLGQKGGTGELIQIDVSNISGGGGTPGGTVEGAIQIRNAAGDGFSAFDNIRVDAGKLVAIAANPTDVPFTVQGTSLQSANLIEAKDDGDATLFSVSSDGTVLPTRGVAGCVFLGTAGNTAASSSTAVCIGTGAGAAVTSANFIAIGVGAGAAVTSGGGNVCIGPSAGDSITTGINNFALGTASLGGVSTGGGNIAIGASSMNASGPSVGQNVAIGSGAMASATGSSQVTAIGDNALPSLLTHSNLTAVGYQAGTGQLNPRCVFLGGFTSGGAFSDAIALGAYATVTAAKQFVVGNVTSPIEDFYIGEGVTSPSPTDFTIHGTGGSGADIAAGDFCIAGGKGTGNAAGGDILFKTSDAGVSGATLQSLTTKMRLTSAGGLVLPALPTADPAISGALWNNSGVINISAG